MRDVARSGRIAVVPARYGEGVVGGAETVLREIAHGLAARAWDVDVLTTCARDHFTWVNELPAGVERDGAVTVRRFPAVVSTPRRERAALNAAIVARQPIALDAQMRWMNDDMRVPALFDHLLAHGDTYRAIVFAPYLFWPAYACGQLEPKRSILMPCLHDEPEAHLDIFQDLFGSVRGIWFLSEPERDLAQRIVTRLAPSEVVGSGVEMPARYDPEAFRRAHGIDGPFVLYAGRREGGKNWEQLLAGFAAAVERHPDLPLSLVTIGSGPVVAPSAIAHRVHDLGFLPESERDDAFAAADAYLQPSVNESFSRTMMEAWLAGTLVIANGGGAVNRWHCERSGAGLLYDDDFELEECLRFVARRARRRRPARRAWSRLRDGSRVVAGRPGPDGGDARRVDVTGRHRMRILLVADYPPPYGPVVDATVAEVRALRRSGHDVEVCSPAPSAAHHHRELTSAAGLASFVRLARGFDRVLVRVQSSTPVDRRFVRALRAVPECEVVAYGIDPDHPVGAALATTRGISVEHRAAAGAPVPGRPTPGPGNDATWPAGDVETVMAEVRARAARHRGAATVSAAAERRTAPLRQLAPLALPEPVSLRPGASVVKRLVRRLTAWQVDPIVGQVNRLREAIVVALEQTEDTPPG